MSDDHIRLNGFSMFCPIHLSPGLWKHPDDESHRHTDLDYWVELAQTLEEGKFDSLFLADIHGTYNVYDGDRDAALRHAVQSPVYDPLTLLPALSRETDDLGLATTLSTTHVEPFMAAKKLSTLDQLTDGRVA